MHSWNNFARRDPARLPLMSIALLPSLRLYTAEELLEMSTAAIAAESRFELVEGKLIAMPPTSDEHGWSTSDISVAIGHHVRVHDLGRCWAAETGFLLARDPADTVLAPDFAFVAKARLNYPRAGRGYVPIAPDLVVETRSPSDRLTAMTGKINLWLSFGVQMALLLDPTKRTLTVYAPGAEPLLLTTDDTFSGGDVLPGFALPLVQLFRE